MNRLVVALALLALHPTAACQEPPLLMHLTVAGPAEWRARLGPTNLGSMLASAEAEALWRGYVDHIDETLREAHGDDEGFARERARALDYRGDLHLIAWLEQEEDALNVPRWSMALIAAPDGTTNLEAMATECRAWLDRFARRRAKPWRELRLSPPRVENGRLIAVLACVEDFDRVVERAKGLPLDPLPRSEVARCEVIVPSALGLLRDRASDRGFFEALLGPATQRATVTIGSAGPRLRLDLSLTFADGDRGLAAGLYPALRGVPELDWLVPEGTATHYAWRIDLPAVWRAWLHAQATLYEFDREQMRERARLWYGCDVDSDLLSLLGDESLLLWTHCEQDEEPTLLANACLVVPVRDERKLAAAIDDLAQRIGTGRREWVGDALGTEFPHFCVSIDHGVACLWLHRAGRELIAEIFERAADPPAAIEPAAALPRGAPAGCNGRGSLDISTMVVRDLYAQLRWLSFALGQQEHLPQVVRIAREAERWLPLLKSYSLASARTLGGSIETNWTLRMLW